MSGQNQSYNFRQQANPYGRQTMPQMNYYGGPPSQPVTYQTGSNPYSGWSQPTGSKGGGGMQQSYAPATQPMGKGGGAAQAPFASQQPYQPNTSNGGAWVPQTPLDGSGTPQGSAPPGMGWGIKPDGSWGWVQVAGNPNSDFGTFGGLNPQSLYGVGGQSVFRVN